MKRQGVFLLPPGWGAIPSDGQAAGRVTPPTSPPRIKFAGTRLYTWVERGTVRVSCPRSSWLDTLCCYNTMCPARTRTRTARSGDALTMRPLLRFPSKLYIWGRGGGYKGRLYTQFFLPPFSQHQFRPRHIY